MCIHPFPWSPQISDLKLQSLRAGVLQLKDASVLKNTSSRHHTMMTLSKQTLQTGQGHSCQEVNTHMGSWENIIISLVLKIRMHVLTLPQIYVGNSPRDIEEWPQVKWDQTELFSHKGNFYVWNKPTLTLQSKDTIPTA